jgi:hypothetical protein
MSDHIVIRKFMGIWPTEKALMGWVHTRWKVEGEMDLKLGSKGFFAVIFSCSEDRDQIFEGGLYLFNLTDLHLRY